MSSTSGSYAVPGNPTVSNVSLVSGAGYYVVAGYDSTFSRDFEAWFPRAFNPETWTGAIVRAQSWTPEKKQAESWTSATKQPQNWTPAIIQPDIWTIE
jgi:hypothetical protein